VDQPVYSPEQRGALEPPEDALTRCLRAASRTAAAARPFLSKVIKHQETIICASRRSGLLHNMSASGFILVVLAVSLWPGKTHLTSPYDDVIKEQVVIVGFMTPYFFFFLKGVMLASYWPVLKY